jgi:hypothetical protein
MILITNYYKINKRSIILDKLLIIYIIIPRGVTSFNNELAVRLIRIFTFAYYINLDIFNYIR